MVIAPFTLSRRAFLPILLFLPLTLKAAPTEWTLIPSESSLSFSGVQNNAPVNGEFKTFSAKLFVDPKDLSAGSIDILVDINSLSTSYAELQFTLLTADWFNVKLFPQAEFKASQFKQTGKNSYTATGTLTIRDKTLPLTLNFIAAEPDPNKRVVVGNVVIKRTSFGVGQGEWENTDTVKDEVTVSFKVSAVMK